MNCIEKFSFSPGLDGNRPVKGGAIAPLAPITIGADLGEDESGSASFIIREQELTLPCSNFALHKVCFA